MSIITWRSRTRHLLSIRRALKPDGRLVVIDFDRVEGRSTEFVLKHVSAANPFSSRRSSRPASGQSQRRKPPAFKENFFLSFEKRVRPVGSKQ